MAPGGTRFVCRRCGECCLGAGGVRLTEAELPAVAGHLGLSTNDLRARYLTSRPGGPGGEGRLEVGVGPDGRCLLFGEGGCLVHPVKPANCRLWPFFPRPLSGEGAFMEAASHCPGLADLDYRGFLAAFEARA